MTFWGEGGAVTPSAAERLCNLDYLPIWTNREAPINKLWRVLQQKDSIREFLFETKFRGPHWGFWWRKKRCTSWMTLHQTSKTCIHCNALVYSYKCKRHLSLQLTACYCQLTLTTPHYVSFSACQPYLVVFTESVYESAISSARPRQWSIFRTMAIHMEWLKNFRPPLTFHGFVTTGNIGNWNYLRRPWEEDGLRIPLEIFNVF